MEIVCSILEPDVGRAFSVKISREEIVDALKDAIKEKKAPDLDHIAASRLDIWKVSKPTHPNHYGCDMTNIFAAQDSLFRRCHR